MIEAILNKLCTKNLNNTNKNKGLLECYFGLFLSNIL